MNKALVVLFLTPTLAFAQSRFLVGVNAAGVLNSYLFSKEVGPVDSEGKLNWEVGLTGKCFISKKFAIDLKTNLASKNFNSVIDFDKLKWIDPNDPLLGNTSGKYRYSVNQTFLEMPVSFSYFPKGTAKKINNYFSLGIVCSKRIASSSKDEYASNFIVDPNSNFAQYRDFLVSARPSFGLMIDLGNNFVCFSEVYSTIYLQTVGSTGNPFQLGLNFSVLKKLGKAN